MQSQEQTRESGGSSKTTLVAVVLALAGVASLVLACMIGPYPLSLGQVFSGLGSLVGLGAPDDARVVTVVLDIRLARGVLSWCLGAGLALSGAAFQGLLRNPLADPFTLGVSSGAAFGASLAISLGLGAAFSGLGLSVAGLLGALLSLAVVLALGRSQGRLRRETVVLAGIVTATFLSALISLVKAVNEESVAAIVFWIMGSLQGRSWAEALVYMPWFAVGSAVLLVHWRELDLLSLGDTQARQLGLNAGRKRLVLLLAASLIAGAGVAVSGVIGFVGLIVPHIARILVGSENSRLLPVSFLAGGVLLLWSDVLARVALPHGAELPVGVITALLGGPFFCILLRRRAMGGEP